MADLTAVSALPGRRAARALPSTVERYKVGVEPPLAYLWIAIGSALGGVGRYACSRVLADRLGEAFPWGTLAVNVLGSFIIGVFAALAGSGGRLAEAPGLRLFVMVGLCGGFTTFSAFSLQTIELLGQRDFAGAGANVAASVILCLAAVWLGFIAAQALGAMRPAG